MATSGDPLGWPAAGAGGVGMSTLSFLTDDGGQCVGGWLPPVPFLLGVDDNSFDQLGLTHSNSALQPTLMQVEVVF